MFHRIFLSKWKRSRNSKCAAPSAGRPHLQGSVLPPRALPPRAPHTPHPPHPPRPPLLWGQGSSPRRCRWVRRSSWTAAWAWKKMVIESYLMVRSLMVLRVIRMVILLVIPTRWWYQVDFRQCRWRRLMKSADSTECLYKGSEIPPKKLHLCHQATKVHVSFQTEQNFTCSVCMLSGL